MALRRLRPTARRGRHSGARLLIGCSYLLLLASCPLPLPLSFRSLPLCPHTPTPTPPSTVPPKPCQACPSPAAQVLVLAQKERPRSNAAEKKSLLLLASPARFLSFFLYRPLTLSPSALPTGVCLPAPPPPPPPRPHPRLHSSRLVHPPSGCSRVRRLLGSDCK